MCACLLALPAVARLLFYPDLAASGVPARLLQQLWPPALGSSICSPLGNA